MRVLIVSPQFAPSNAAESHRVRLLLPHLAALGWQAEVLCIDPRDVPAPHDDWLEQRLPASVPIHRVRAWRARFGLGRGLAQRSAFALHRAGSRLLAGGRFDLVFFSTTVFLLHLLGPAWRRAHGTPFCMDYQDPWVTDYYRIHPQVVPPGGRLKYRVAETLDRLAEPRVVRDCSGLLSVSNAYLHELQRRYGEAVASLPKRVAPFPGEPDELREALPVAASRDADLQPTWRYVGRGGADMRRAAAAFFGAWRAALDAGSVGTRGVRFEAIGTSYARGGGQSFAPIAEEAGLRDRVDERPERIGYRAMLEALRASDALVIFGSDDPAYTASKLYPYLLAGRPLLAILHRDSPAVALIGRVGGARCVTFGADTSHEALVRAVRLEFEAMARGDAAPALSMSAFEPHTARAQARVVTQWWTDCLRYARSSGVSTT